ncbi:hypothetical protein ATANTOWER_002191 [Ataeniobius toweri]|uniref:Uncharacterized protein n=1 Tax=Ataeniobius toweri TaxID=208326 RepID=A0ABU7CE29_9TELE|nr:hypothetical protein [Ataeniobius toweri]
MVTLHRQRFLYAARDKGKVKLGDHELSFYQDFSAEVVTQRQTSANACKRMRDAGIKYAFLYPAVIQVFPPKGKLISLTTMREVNDYIRGALLRVIDFSDLYKLYSLGALFYFMVCGVEMFRHPSLRLLFCLDAVLFSFAKTVFVYQTQMIVWYSGRTDSAQV